MDGACVITRDLRDPEDLPFLYSTWRNSAYYGHYPRRQDSTEDMKRFFKEATTEIRKTLEKAKVKIACLEDDPTTILGYVVFTGKHLNWIYVKESYRRQGLANLLGFNSFESYPKQVTRIGHEIMKKKKENADGRTRNQEAAQSKD